MIQVAKTQTELEKLSQKHWDKVKGWVLGSIDFYIEVLDWLETTKSEYYLVTCSEYFDCKSKKKLYKKYFHQIEEKNSDKIKNDEAKQNTNTKKCKALCDLGW